MTSTEQHQSGDPYQRNNPDLYCFTAIKMKKSISPELSNKPVLRYIITYNK